MMLLFAALLLQINRDALRTEILAVMQGEDDVLLRDRVPGVEEWFDVSIDARERFLARLQDDDPTVRRNAAWALAIYDIPDGLEFLTVDDDEPWPRRLRIAQGRGSVDPDGAHEMLRRMLRDPSARARTAALYWLGEPADAVAMLADPSPRVTAEALRILEADSVEAAAAAHGVDLTARRLERREGVAAWIADLESEDPQTRDRATRDLLTIDESEIPLLEAHRTADEDVRGRLRAAAEAARRRDVPPVTLTHERNEASSSGVVRVMKLTNSGSAPLTYSGDRDGAPRWTIDSPGRIVTTPDGGTAPGISHRIEPGESVTFRVRHRDDQPYRVWVGLRSESGLIGVYSVEFLGGE